LIEKKRRNKKGGKKKDNSISEIQSSLNYMKAYIFAMTLLSKIKSSRSKRKGLFAILS
jgi:hypothetical protein